MVPSITCDVEKCNIRTLMSTSMRQVNASKDIDIIVILNDDSYTDQGVQIAGCRTSFRRFGLASATLVFWQRCIGSPRFHSVFRGFFDEYLHRSVDVYRTRVAGDVS